MAQILLEDRAAEERLDALRQALSDTTLLLAQLWRCRTDRERAELGPHVAQAVVTYGKQPREFERLGL